MVVRDGKAYIPLRRSYWKENCIILNKGEIEVMVYGILLVTRSPTLSISAIVIFLLIYHFH
jgi:hypothetical protein